MFSFKEVKQRKGNASSGQWHFEKVESPSSYQQYMQKRNNKDIVEQKCVGYGYASHWMIGSTNCASTTRTTSEATTNQTTENVPKPPVIVDTVQLYRAMFEQLVGKQELARIEKRYTMNQLRTRTNSSRKCISIRDVIIT
jgi:hypothetical protein